MPADTSPNSQNSRYQRAAERTLASANGDAGARTLTMGPGASENLRSDRIIPTDRPTRRPKRSGGGKLDEILSALGGGARGDSDGAQGDEDRSRQDRREPSRGDQTARRFTEDGNLSMGQPDDANRRAFDFDEDDDDDAQGDKPKRKKRQSLAEFAEAHEVKPEALYGLEISLEAGSEPVTIGQLKDHFKEHRGFETLRDDFEDYRQQAQSEIIQGRQQLDAVVGIVAAHVEPGVLKQLAEQITAMSADVMAQGKRQLREWFPEWENPDVAKKARSRMAEVVQQYGFSDVEFSAISDPRIIRLLHDAIRKADRYDALRKGIREAKAEPKQAPAARRHRLSPEQEARSMAASGDKIGAIARLIG